MKITTNPLVPRFPEVGEHIVTITGITLSLKTVILDLKDIHSVEGLSKKVRYLSAHPDKATTILNEIAQQDESQYGPMLAKYYLERLNAKKISNEDATKGFCGNVHAFKILVNGRVKVTDAFETITFTVSGIDAVQRMAVTNIAVLLGLAETCFPQYKHQSVSERKAMYPNGFPFNDLSELVGKEATLYYNVKQNNMDPSRPYRDWWVRPQSISNEVQND